MLHPSGGLCMTNQDCAQAGNVQRGRIIPGAIPETLRIGAGKPGSPVANGAAMMRGSVGVGWFPAPRAGMRGMTRVLPLQANSHKETFVAQDTPQFPAHLGIVAPIPPAP